METLNCILMSIIIIMLIIIYSILDLFVKYVKKLRREGYILLFILKIRRHYKSALVGN